VVPGAEAGGGVVPVDGGGCVLPGTLVERPGTGVPVAGGAEVPGVGVELGCLGVFAIAYLDDDDFGAAADP
jgi:hypothetical protein